MHNLRGVVVGDGLDEVAQLAAGLGLQLEDLLQATRGDEGSARGDIVGKHLGKLVDNVLEDVLGRVVQQGLSANLAYIARDLRHVGPTVVW